jgi:hypothetical protein
MIEIWNDIPGYEGFYQASNLGRIKSLSRLINRSRGGKQRLKESILKTSICKSGYATVALSAYGIARTKHVHRLIASAFFGESTLVIDHINQNRADNRLINLRYCTQRDNLGFNRPSLGVSINPPVYKKRFRARIRINDSLKSLGSFHTKIEAQNVYLQAKSNLKSINQ